MSVELSRRLVACEGFRWMPGMLSGRHNGRCVDASDPSDLADGESQLVRWTRGHWKCTDYQDPEPDDYPDLDDPATLGCIEHGLLPEAYGTTSVSLSPDGVTWAVFVDGEKVSEAYTKREALVAALDAAPKKAGTA